MPVAGPAVFVYMGFGVVLLLLLVPPLALLATVVGVALVVLAGAILEASFRLVRLLRGHPLGHFSLSVPHIRTVVRRA